MEVLQLQTSIPCVMTSVSVSAEIEYNIYNMFSLVYYYLKELF